VKTRPLLAAVVAATLTLAAHQAAAVTLNLKAGTFYGPGDKGVHPFQNGQVRNIQLDGSLQGRVPFFNNGSDPPNVIAEVLQGGPVDGYTSDGRAINENIDTALHLQLEDKTTGQSGSLMVVSTGEEVVQPDEKGNLVFVAHVFADPGVAALVTPLVVRFTSGAARIPLSLRTQNGIAGGHDFAGPFPSGHTLIGRIGDFDHDHFLDGELVQGENSPLELVIARGDPIAQHRPWVSDIPTTPALSALLNLNGIVQNFPEAMTRALRHGRIQAAIDYGYDINGRLNAALYDLGAITQAESSTRSQRLRAHAAKLLVRLARWQIERGLDMLQDHKDEHGRGEHGGSFGAGAFIKRGLQTVSFALLQAAPDQPQAKSSAPAPNSSEADAASYAGEMLRQALGRT
jgi:hypothetical protein